MTGSVVEANQLTRASLYNESDILNHARLIFTYIMSARIYLARDTVIATCTACTYS